MEDKIGVLKGNRLPDQESRLRRKMIPANVLQGYNIVEFNNAPGY